MSADTHLSPCGCCGGEPREPGIHNRPGLPALDYRIGSHSEFLRRMLERIPAISVDGGARPLAALTTRAPDDPALALLDAWATVADVLTFYQERIANEGYLRTATERRSVLELARTIGYELAPGVAASTFLTFTVEDSPGAPARSLVPLGTRVQSIPEQGQLPQPFETSSEIEARREWNALLPRLAQPQTLEIDGEQLYLVGLDGAKTPAQQIFLAGSETTLKAGERILIALEQGGSIATLAPRIRRVTFESERNRTRVELAETPVVPPFAAPMPLLALPFIQKVAFSKATVTQHVLGRSWRERDLRTFLAVQRWNAGDLVKHVAAPPPPPAPLQTGVFALRQQVGIFGHNAQAYAALPEEGVTKGNPYPKDWDASGGFPIWRNPATGSSSVESSYHADADLFLERKVDGILSGGWAVLEQSTGAAETFQVLAAKEISTTGFGLSAKTTGLVLATTDGDPLGNDTTDKPDAYKVRKTTAHVQSERVELADLPIEDELEVGDDAIMLGSLVLDLEIGQPIVLTGERSDAAGVLATEVLILTEVIHQGGFTTLYFESGLEHGYLRETVTLSANVVEATHGETVTEVLGSGDGGVANQRFTLRKPPLTHVSATTPTGRRSTLQVRVGDVLWEEATSLFGLGRRAQRYAVRLEDDGTTAIVFGDGKQGARVPSGSENVRAVYRSGIGPAGEVAAGSLTLLQTRPHGIRGVTNPIPATGSEEPEQRDEARRNAPLAVLTFDRIVSIRDYQDFARAFAGIGKAQAVALWNGEDRLVHITIASATGATVEETSPLYRNLRDAIDESRNPIESVIVASFQPLHFNVSAGLVIDPRYEFEPVSGWVEEALNAAFSFEARGFGQDVTAAEVVAVIHGVTGVVATVLKTLDLATEGEAVAAATLATRLSSEATRWEDGEVLPGQLLIINPAGITLEEMQP